MDKQTEQILKELEASKKIVEALDGQEYLDKMKILACAAIMANCVDPEVVLRQLAEESRVVR